MKMILNIILWIPFIGFLMIFLSKDIETQFRGWKVKISSFLAYHLFSTMIGLIFLFNFLLSSFLD